jgi:LysM repeat protein
MDQRTRRSPARFLAPLALIAVLVAFLAIVSGSSEPGSPPSSSDETTSTSSTKSTTTATKTSTAKTQKKSAKAGASDKTYTVQVGDTLGGIADKTGVPLERIEELNPDVDPHTMNAGQEIRLK